MSAWAEVDGWKQKRIAAAAEVCSAQALVRNNIRQIRAEKRMRKNVERWFRELPPLLVQTMAQESTGVMAFDVGLIAVANDWLLERGFEPGRHLPRRAAVESEKALIAALQACRFPPASFAKRFARELDPARVTDGQVAQLRRLVTKFRKQIPPAALHEADRHLLIKPKKSSPP